MFCDLLTKQEKANDSFNIVMRRLNTVLTVSIPMPNCLFIVEDHKSVANETPSSAIESTNLSKLFKWQTSESHLKFI